MSVCVYIYTYIYMYEFAGWYYRCSRHELGQALEDDEEQGSLACCSPWGCKEFVKSVQLNNYIYIYIYIYIHTHTRTHTYIYILRAN